MNKFLIKEVCVFLFSVSICISAGNGFANTNRKDRWIEPSTGLEFVKIKGDCFLMGSPANEVARGRDENQVEMCISDFWVSRTEVTNQQYRLYKKNHSSGIKKVFLKGKDFEEGKEEGKIKQQMPLELDLDGEKQPVVSVSWEDANDFALWLSKKSGRDIRLPTEAEWEFAARGGKRTSRFWGDSQDNTCHYANINDLTSRYVNSRGDYCQQCEDGFDASAPVGSFAANPFGLYDMLGNVWEWTADSYSCDYKKTNNNMKVMRGGSWLYCSRYVRSALRMKYPQDKGSSTTGFRLAFSAQ